MKTYITGDTHFNHTNIAKYTNRPDNWEELVIQNWNNTITNNDIVIHLGDFCLGGSTIFHKYLSQLNGFKLLIKGNHDNKSVTWYMNNGFFIAGKQMIRVVNNNLCLLTHHPQQIKDLEWCDFNICAHIHNNPNVVLSPKHRLYSIENYNYQPILIESIL